MALTLPLSTDFIDRLAVTGVTFSPSWGQEMSGVASGRIRVKERRSMLWRARLDRGDLTAEEAEELLADILALDGAMYTFYCYNPRRPYPKADPDGSILGASNVQIHTVGGDNKTLRLKGLPAGYVLSRGDYLSFDYGTSPVSRAFHMIEEAATADGAGVTPVFEVRPLLRPGAEADIVVTLAKPAAEMMLLRDDLETDGYWSDATLEAIQVL